MRVAAVGKATAQVLRQRGWPVDLVPDEANAAALVAAFAARWAPAGCGHAGPVPGKLARTADALRPGLKQLGAAVTQVEAYRTDSAAA